MSAHVCSWRWPHSVTYFKRLMAAHLFSSRPQSNSRSFQLPTCWLQTMLWFNWMHHFLNWEWEKGIQELPLKSADTECMSTWNMLSKKDGGHFLHVGKMQSRDLVRFQTKVNGCSIGTFLYFWPVSSNRENKNSWRNVLGLCSLEEEMMVIVLHFCYSALEIALYF